MAKKRKASTAIARPTYYAQPTRTPAPIVRVTVPSPKKAKRRASHSSKGGGGNFTKTLMGAALTTALVGYAEKSGILNNLPQIPIIGRKGTLAVAAYFWSKNGGGQIARDVAMAAAILSAYEFSKDGTISGAADYT